MSARIPGYGDAETWPACYGHPNDPRTDDYEEKPDTYPMSSAQDAMIRAALCRSADQRRERLDYADCMAVIAQIMQASSLSDAERRWAAYGVWRFFTARHGARAEHAKQLKEQIV